MTGETESDTELDAEYRSKLEKVQEGNLALEDDKGDLYTVDTFDDEGAFLYSRDTDTYRYTHFQIQEIFEFVDA